MAEPPNSGPVPWPLPPRINSLGQREFAHTDSDSIVDGNRGVPLQSLTSRGEGTNSAKLSRQVFKKISELYPNPVGNVLRVDQVPEYGPSPLRTKQESESSLQQTQRQIGGNTGAPIVRESVSSCDSSYKSGEDVVSLYREDDDGDFGAMLDLIGSDEGELQPADSCFRKVHLSDSTRDLFHEDSDFITPRSSLQVSKNVGDDSPPFTFGGKNVVSFEMDTEQDNSGSDREDEHGVDVICASRELSSQNSRRTFRRARRSSENVELTTYGNTNSTKSNPNRHPSVDDQNEDLNSAGHRQILRRPLGSRRKTLVDLKEVSTPAEEIRKVEDNHDLQHQQENPDIEPGYTENAVKSRRRRSFGTAKGVIMRTFSQHGYVKGIRRAETGHIMSRDELRARRSKDFSENPIPKSLRPPMFLNDDEDGAPSLSPDSFRVSPRYDTFIEFKSPSKRGSFRNGESQARHSTSSRRNSVFDETSFGSGGFEEPAGFVARLGTGIKRAAFAFGRRPTDDDFQNDIIVSGTIDEAVCRLSHICRKYFKYDVIVKDGGRKIKVNSTTVSAGSYLRATLLLRNMPGNEAICAVRIRQSRSDGTKTTIATLWAFFQKLDEELRKWSQLSVPAGSLFAKSP